MRFRADEKGQMLVLTALSMAALLGFLALAVDVGLLFRAKRKVQTAADAGAISAALEYSYNGLSSNVAAVAGTAVTNNGVTLSYTPSLNTGCPNRTSNCAIVNTSTSAITGYHNTAGYVQVIVAQPNPTFFMGMFGDSTVRVPASAIAGIEPNPDCLITLAPTGANSFWIKGNSNVDTNNCGVHVNSSDPAAVCVQGSATIDGPYLKIDGHQSGSGKCNKNPGAPVYNGAGTVKDPFGGFGGPNPNVDGSCSAGSSDKSPVAVNNTYTQTTLNFSTSAQLTAFNALTPYKWTDSSGVSVNVICFSQNVTLTNFSTASVAALLNPSSGSIYVFEQGVNIGNNNSFTNTTLDNYNGTFNDENGTLNIAAPVGKALAGNAIAIMQPSYNLNGTCSDASLKATPCLQVQFGSTGVKNPSNTTCSGSTDQLCGYIYAPTATVYLQDEGGGVEAAGVVAGNFYNNGSLDILNSYNFVNPSTTPLSTVALVE